MAINTRSVCYTRFGHRLKWQKLGRDNDREQKKSRNIILMRRQFDALGKYSFSVVS